MGNLGLKVPKAHDAKRMEKLVEIHESLAAAYAAYLASAEGGELVDAFRRQFADQAVSPVKMLDLVLWQIRG